MRPPLPPRRPRAPFLRPSGDPVAAEPAPADGAPATPSQAAPVEVPPQPVLRPLATNPDGRPARRVMVRATHTAGGLRRSLPAFNAIRDALSRIDWNEVPAPAGIEPHVGGAPVPTAWIGPVPRVVRRGHDASAAQETDVAWPLQLAEGEAFTDSMIGAAQQNRRLQIERALARLSGSPEDPAGGWSGVSIVPYAEALHGPVTWWQSGMAGRTRTFERYPSAGEVDMQENPQGPTSADLQNPDYLTWLRDQNLMPTVGFPWGVVAGGAAAFLGAIYLMAKAGGGSREVVIRADHAPRRRKGGA